MLARRSLIIPLLLVPMIVLPSASFAGISTTDLSITKTDGAATSTPGTDVTYTIVATNEGALDDAGVTVADSFPVILSGCTWTCTASAGSSCTAAGAGDINDSVSLLAAGTATYTATCTIDPSATGVLANTATVSSAMDLNPANDSATDTNTLTPMADLSIGVVPMPANVSVGQNFTLDVTVDNAGPSDATNVVVTTTLPPWATFISTSGCAEDPNGVPTCTLGTIAAGGTAGFTITAQASDPGSDPVTVTVTSSTPDPNPGNDTASVTVSAVAPVVEVPTLSQVGQALMALLLLGAALWAIRR